MGGVSEQAVIKLGPWPAGVNNVDAEHDLPKNEQTNAVIALREAVNVDLDSAGWPVRRSGYSNVIAANRAHSLFSNEGYMYAVVDGDLVAYAGDPLASAGTVLAGIGDHYASFAAVNEDVYWTNGVQIRRIRDALTDAPAALATPPSPTVESYTNGGMTAGEYEISITWVDADGRESGASPAVAVTLIEGRGFLISNLPITGETAVYTRVYCTQPNGDVLYLAATIPATQPVLYLGAFTPGRALETQWLVPLPPGQIVRFWNGRVLVAANNLLCWSDALRFGLMHQDSTLRFGHNITLLEPVGEGGDGSGVYIADHKRTYFMAGDRPDKWQRVIRYPHAAVPGTSAVLPGTAFGLDTTAPVAFWLAANGVFVLGMPNGEVKPITEGRLALPESDRGSSMFREVQGIRQIVTSMTTGEVNAFGVTDSASATIRRHGVTVG